MPKSRPSVSVVIPCYRYGRFLEQCVHSILRQDGVDVRVLIIDDASPDDSFEVAEKLAANDSRVEARRHTTNHGHISTYNEGLLGWASGDYSVLISADDIVVPGAFARATAIMDRHPDVGMVYGHAINWIDNRPLPTPRLAQTGTRIWKGQDWVKTICQLGHNIVTSPEVVVRTAIQRKVGGYRPELPHSGDLEMWLRFAARSDIAFVKGADQAYYRIHASNMTTKRSPDIDLAQRVVAFRSFFKDSGHLLNDAGALQSQAMRQVAREALWRASRAYDRRRTDQTPVAALKSLAEDAYPHSDRLLEHWGLRWRERAGSTIVPYFQLFTLFPALNRRLRMMLFWRRWKREGY